MSSLDTFFFSYPYIPVVNIVPRYVTAQTLNEFLTDEHFTIAV
ncbi:hypothetical protein Nitsa_1569 [Nitratifractor salsuginis DSM 16511]|uniref:Uncharacterized protein n=1 Tax=Nitratifractor salsuginis (strain DSM 16511 / JCM 12458 / E9I37-1) TaxID=749222 RepID=E6X0G7_NITSE|nr:hypothetical protein Nitsa_1569 [Nitratifractor salsuginis DSM 16511]